jgi:hypothetical protein
MKLPGICQEKTRCPVEASVIRPRFSFWETASTSIAMKIPDQAQMTRIRMWAASIS